MIALLGTSSQTHTSNLDLFIPSSFLLGQGVLFWFSHRPNDHICQNVPVKKLDILPLTATNTVFLPRIDSRV